MANLPASVLSLPNIGPGSTDKASVTALQQALVAAGYLTQTQMNSGPGIYGPQTTAAVSAWQSANGINTAGNPGYFGPASKSFVQTHQSSSTPAPTPTPAPVTPTSTSGATTSSGAPTVNFNTQPSVPTGNPINFPMTAPTGNSGSTTSSSPIAPNASGTQGPSTQSTSQGSGKGQLPASLLQQITGNLGPGSTGAQVLALQQALVAAGYLTQSQLSSGPGTYGPQTTAAVSAWQSANGIKTNGASGYFGPASKAFIIGPNNLSSISPTLPKSDYSTTPDGSAAGGDTSHTPPDGVIDPGAGSTDLYNIPPESFSTLVPQLTPGTPEYQTALDNVETSYYDVLQQQMTASTEQEQQVANYNWTQLKNYIQTNLNVTLSNDAMQGWDQIQGLKSQYGALNLEDSGLQHEAVDVYLNRIRASDSATRTTAQTQQQAAQESYYQNYATPDQIQALVQSNPTQAAAWGLTPSASVAAAMNFNSLKAKYPTLSDDQINGYIASVVDSNGNYRSALYQKYMVGNTPGTQAGAVDPSQTIYDPLKLDGNGNPLPVSQQVTPGDTGILDIQAAKKQDQEVNVGDQGAVDVWNAKQKQGLNPSNTGTDMTKNTQFDRAVPNDSNTGAGTPATNAPASPSNPVPSSTKTYATNNPAPTYIPQTNQYSVNSGFTQTKTAGGGTAYNDAQGNLYVNTGGGYTLRNDLK